MQRIITVSKLLGFDIVHFWQALKGLPTYYKNYKTFKRVSTSDFPLRTLRPCLTDRFATAGVARGHYFHQDLYVAQQLYKNSPTHHLDIGSRVDGFVAHVATFMPVEVGDVRELTTNSANIQFQQLDLVNIDSKYHAYTSSLSCLHTLEHVGLGRYGDTIMADGHRVAFKNLVYILRPGGTLYFSVPIGEQRVEFDAHRVFALQTLLDLFAEHCLQLESTSYVDDAGSLHTGVSLTAETIADSLGCTYGCGIFILTKPL